MTNELVRTTSTVGESNLHLQITPAYRRDIFRDEEVEHLTRAYMHEKLEQLKIAVLAEDCGPDHWHLFLANWKNYSIPKIAQYVKDYSSYMMRKHHWHLFRNKLWGNKFWTEGYFYRTVGVVNKETMQRYIEQSQSKHWHKVDARTYEQRKQLQLTAFVKRSAL